MLSMNWGTDEPDRRGLRPHFLPLGKEDYRGVEKPTKTPCRKRRAVPLGKEGQM